MKCSSCGADTFINYGNEEFIVCADCSKSGVTARDTNLEAEEKLKNEVDGIIVTTSNLIEGRPVKKILDIIWAECVYGSNLLKDVFSGVRDVVGGRAKSVQKIISDARREALYELKLQAVNVGADAIIAINFQISEISEKGTMIMVSVTGTAVQIFPSGLDIYQKHYDSAT